MGMTALGRFSIRIALGVLCLCVIAIAAKSDAHENDPKSRNLEPPIHGQAFHRGEEGGVAGSEYASDGIRLESWLPPNITSPGETNGNDCWGYVSTSGRGIRADGTPRRPRCRGDNRAFGTPNSLPSFLDP